jgi:hypothetical protein
MKHKFVTNTFSAWVSPWGNCLAPKIKNHIESLIETAGHQVAFCRDLRNRRMAHSELALALDHLSAAPLPALSRAQVREALRANGYVLNVLEEHYGCSASGFEHTIPALGGAGSLLAVIEPGVAVRVD